MPAILGLRRLRQLDRYFEASIGYIPWRETEVGATQTKARDSPQVGEVG